MPYLTTIKKACQNTSPCILTAVISRIILENGAKKTCSTFLVGNGSPSIEMDVCCFFSLTVCHHFPNLNNSSKYIAMYFDTVISRIILENGAEKNCSTFFSGKRKPLNRNGCLLLLLVNGSPSSPKFE